MLGKSFGYLVKGRLKSAMEEEEQLSQTQLKWEVSGRRHIICVEVRKKLGKDRRIENDDNNQDLLEGKKKTGYRSNGKGSTGIGLSVDTVDHILRLNCVG